ncbi:MAG: hypothetical protein OEY38_09160 [Gammaproteobacteria bacterium]|nr:hypothetical protein [Gammaproteobacteria bacterium]
MIEKLLNWKIVTGVAFLGLVLLYTFQIVEAPNRLLQDVLVYEEGQKNVLQVKFNLPVRYENHFPQGPSDFVQIKIRPVSLSGVQKNEYIGSDTILPGFLEKVPVSDIAYEGDVNGGPFLSLRFSKPVNYQIAEDSSMRSILLILPAS